MKTQPVSVRYTYIVDIIQVSYSYVWREQYLLTWRIENELSEIEIPPKSFIRGKQEQRIKGIFIAQNR